MGVRTMDDEAGDAPRQSELGRVEAFSDGVIAIIVTIMVLELHVPEHPGLAGLIELWPIFLAYVLSFTYVAIYWVNHHRLFTHARRVSNSLLWSNMALLFTLSLIPFVTAYLGEHGFGHFAILLYILGLALPALTYATMEAVIERQARQANALSSYLFATRRKSYVSAAIYGLGIAASFLNAGLALASAVLVAIFWILPDTPVDRMFGCARGDISADHP